MNLYAQALLEISILQEEIQNDENLIRELPAGHLVTKRNGANYKWFNRTSVPGRAKPDMIYIPKKDFRLASGLATKQYLEMKIADLRKEIKALEQYVSLHEAIGPTAEENVAANVPLRELVDKLVLTPEDGRKWMLAEYERAPSHSGELKFRTLAGYMVRSKSEMIIANMLFERGIPFRYEMVQRLNGIITYPDFTILDLPRKKILYWEHFGMMDEETYRKRIPSKIMEYLQCGVIPGDNLIMSFESAQSPLDSNKVLTLINENIHY